MMERRRDLNDALQEGLLRLGFHQPDFLPHFVSFEKFLRVKMQNAALKFLVPFPGIHRLEILFRLNSLNREPS